MTDAKVPNFDAAPEIARRLSAVTTLFERLREQILEDGERGAPHYHLPMRPPGFGEGDSYYPLYHPWFEQESISRADLAAAISDVHYVDGQAPQETLKYPALVAATPETLATVDALNKAKSDFKQYVQMLKKDTSGLGGEKARDEYVSQALSPGKNGRISLWQIYRPISAALPGEHILRARFFLDPRQSLTPKTAGEELERVKKFMRASADESLRLACKALASLPPETPLAHVGSRASIISVNIKYRDMPGRAKRYTASLPVFYHWSPGVKPPEISIGDLSMKGKDPVLKKVELEPIIPKLRLHRYRPGFYPAKRSS